jgi:hypothetical protein
MRKDVNLSAQDQRGQMKMFPKAAADPNSRIRQARRRWKC